MGTTLNEIYGAIKDKVPKLEPIRIPMNQEKAPEEANFDQIVAMLKDTTASCPVIFNCQAGISRTTDMFGDLPRGHHKNNSMHKLASKTMIEILPDNLAAHVEKKCGALAGTPDFFDVIGQVSWYEPEA